MCNAKPLWAVLVGLLILPLAECARPLPILAPSSLPDPAPDAVESVIYLLGDAGYADEGRSPVLRRLSNDIEYWAGAIGRDSAVAVLFLGDIVYPRGLRLTEADYPRDSAIVQSQVNLVAGQHARRFSATGYFMAGNHDWGNARDTDGGLVRLKNLQDFLTRRREQGLNVHLLPAAGEPGPATVDLGRQVRILILDTAWWLLAQDTVRKQRMFRELHAVTDTTDDRVLVVAAHHPLQAAGAHAGFVPFWKAFGLRFLLARSGAIMQDLNSIVYRELTRELLNAFRSAPPLIFAGGHDHSLQVIANDSSPLPRFSLVSGSGSKVSSVGHTDGMVYRASVPGYMRVVVHRSGRVDLFVIAASDEDYILCPGSGIELEDCMTSQTEAFTTRFGLRLK